MPSPTTTFLLEGGWLPSPTTFCDAAWEHPAIKVPRWFAECEGLFSPDHARMPTAAAYFIQLAVERLSEERLRQQCDWIAHAVQSVASMALKLPLGRIT